MHTLCACILIDMHIVMRTVMRVESGRVGWAIMIVACGAAHTFNMVAENGVWW